MKFLCIGHIAFDTTLPLDSFPKENRKYRTNVKIECGGGPASNAAYLLGKWNMETYICGVCGNDYQGKKIKKEFESVGVNTKYMILDDKQVTDCAYIFTNSKTSSRTIISNCYPRADKIIPIKEQFDVILIDKEEPMTSLSILNKNKDAITIVDAGSLNDDTILLSHQVKYLICSKEFAEEFTHQLIEVDKLDKLIKIYDKISNEFNNQVIITLEEKGCFTKINDIYKLIPSIKVNAVDTTAAGDIFHGAFAYFIANNYPLEETLYLSNITAALSTTNIGGRNSIPLLKQVIKIGDKIDII